MDIPPPLPPEPPRSGHAAASEAMCADNPAMPATAPPGDAVAMQALAQRLNYLFRRIQRHPHVLQKSLFIYREVPLP